MAKLYSNENFPIPVVNARAPWGTTSPRSRRRGRANESTPDPDVLSLATAEKRTVLTLNRKDFYRLHEQRPAHAGIIVCVVDPDFQRQAQMIHDRIQVEGDLTGRILRVPPRT